MASLTQLKAEQKATAALAKRYHAQWEKQYRITTNLLAEVKKGTCTRTYYQQQLQDRYADWKKWHKQVNDLANINHEIALLNAKLNKPATTASKALALAVASFEGGESSDGVFRPYRDAVGVWTIGFGHTAADGAPVPGPAAHPLTRAEAETLLLHDLNVYYVPGVARALKAFGWKVNQKQFDALVDFAYNLGTGYFTTSYSIGAAMSHRDTNAVAKAILLYDEAGGHVLGGLVTRRKWESQLFLGGHYSL